MGFDGRTISRSIGVAGSTRFEFQKNRETEQPKDQKGKGKK